jgi:hypothetical protein
MALGLYPPGIDADVRAFLHDVQRYVACAVLTARASEFELCFFGSVHLPSWRATVFVSNHRIVKLGHACVFRLGIGKSCEETYWRSPTGLHPMPKQLRPKQPTYRLKRLDQPVR